MRTGHPFPELPEILSFRLPHGTTAAIDETCRRHGLGRGELLRQALLRRLAEDDALVPAALAVARRHHREAT
ncbi:ribbon-helix-helix protein, CopG family [Methylobacterium sp. JK268]